MISHESKMLNACVTSVSTVKVFQDRLIIFFGKMMQSLATVFDICEAMCTCAR